MLGTVNVANPVLRIDVSASGCNSARSDVITVTAILEPVPASGAGQASSNYSLVALSFSPDGAALSIPTPVVGILFRRDPTSGALVLGARIQPIAACSATTPGSAGPTSVQLSASATLGTFTPATSMTATGSWNMAAVQVVGRCVSAPHFADRAPRH